MNDPNIFSRTFDPDPSCFRMGCDNRLEFIIIFKATLLKCQFDKMSNLTKNKIKSKNIIGDMVSFVLSYSGVSI